MTTPNTQGEQQPLPLLHLYAQESYHWDAFIIGNRAGLQALRDVIDRALTDGHAETAVFPADGEGYGLHVALNDRDWQHPSWDRLLLPYTDEMALDRRSDKISPGQVYEAVRRDAQEGTQPRKED